MRDAGAIKRTQAKTPASKNRIETPLSQAKLYSQEEFEQKVKEVAYQLYVARGCADGYHVEDWLAAEQIVRGS